MKLSLKKILLLGIFSEAVLFLICHLTQPSLEETFRHAARYSGRLSAFVFLISFYLFAFAQPKRILENISLRNWLSLFMLVHIIHFGFLVTNIVLNDIAIVLIKLVGGALAYLMIIIAPLVLHKLKLGLQLVYFYYVNLVMIITYLARAKGDFEGAEPFWFHYLMFVVLILAGVSFGLRIWKAYK